mmetsp:Transcript_9238/g.15734  ORF Transcript_9238/g.15734 Transcript_9238/m.15734 type:complete len:282 (-) Transcript_9238:41-886(-)
MIDFTNKHRSAHSATIDRSECQVVEQHSTAAGVRSTHSKRLLANSAKQLVVIECHFDSSANTSGIISVINLHSLDTTFGQVECLQSSLISGRNGRSSDSAGTDLIIQWISQVHSQTESTNSSSNIGCGTIVESECVIDSLINFAQQFSVQRAAWQHVACDFTETHNCSCIGFKSSNVAKRGQACIVGIAIVCPAEFASSQSSVVEWIRLIEINWQEASCATKLVGTVFACWWERVHAVQRTTEKISQISLTCWRVSFKVGIRNRQRRNTSCILSVSKRGVR